MSRSRHFQVKLCFSFVGNLQTLGAPWYHQVFLSVNCCLAPSTETSSDEVLLLLFHQQYSPRKHWTLLHLCTFATVSDQSCLLMVDQPNRAFPLSRLCFSEQSLLIFWIRGNFSHAMSRPYIHYVYVTTRFSAWRHLPSHAKTTWFFRRK